MAMHFDYPSPTTLGIGVLTIDNGAEQNGASHNIADSRPLPKIVPQDNRNISFAIPKTPALSLDNGGDYKHTILRERPNGFQGQ